MALVFNSMMGTINRKGSVYMTDDNGMSSSESVTFIHKDGVYDQGQQGSSVCHSTNQAIEINLETAASIAPPMYPGMVVDGAILSYQPAEPPKPPTPKQRITAPSVPLSVRRKELARKMRAKR